MFRKIFVCAIIFLHVLVFLNQFQGISKIEKALFNELIITLAVKEDTKNYFCHSHSIRRASSSPLLVVFQNILSFSESIQIKIIHVMAFLRQENYKFERYMKTIWIFSRYSPPFSF